MKYNNLIESYENAYQVYINAKSPAFETRTKSLSKSLSRNVDKSELQSIIKVANDLQAILNDIFTIYEKFISNFNTIINTNKVEDNYEISSGKLLQSIIDLTTKSEKIIKEKLQGSKSDLLWTTKNKSYQGISVLISEIRVEISQKIKNLKKIQKPPIIMKKSQVSKSPNPFQ